MVPDSATLNELQGSLPAFSPALARLSRILFDARIVDLAAQQGIRFATVPAPSDARKFINPASMHLRCAYGDIATIIDLHSHPALASAALALDGDLRAALASALLKQVFERLGKLGCPALTVSSLKLLHDAGDAMDEAIASSLAIRIDSAGGSEIAVVADADASVLSALEDRSRNQSGQLPDFLAKLRLPGRARIGSRLCTPTLLRSLRPGDVLLNWQSGHACSDITSLQDVNMYWGSPRGLQYSAGARIDINLVTLETTPAMSIEEEIMNTQTITDQDIHVVDVAALELPVNLEIVTMVLPVEQIAAMQPGHVMELPVSIADAQIRMVSYGQTLGYGQLVTVGEHLGFQISRMAKQHEPVA
jgi:type III secretion protein Q